MNVYMLHEVYRLVHTAIEYVTGEGALCPVCARFNLGQFKLIVYCTKGDGLRHCRCANCGFTFKTVEKICVSRVPENLDQMPLVNHSKSRKQRKR